MSRVRSITTSGDLFDVEYVVTITDCIKMGYSCYAIGYQQVIENPLSYNFLRWSLPNPWLIIDMGTGATMAAVTIMAIIMATFITDISNKS